MKTVTLTVIIEGEDDEKITAKMTEIMAIASRVEVVSED